MRSVVDLPQPDGPTSTMNSPSAISSETSRHGVEAAGVFLVEMLVRDDVGHANRLSVSLFLHRSERQAGDQILAQHQEYHDDRECSPGSRRRRTGPIGSTCWPGSF